MSEQKSGLVETAYVGSDATGYDDRRFVSRQGRKFDALEWSQINRVLSRVVPGSKVLDVGCGTGRFSIKLGEQGFEVLGVDPSQDMIDIAQKKSAKLEKVSFRQAMVGELESDLRFSLAFTIRVTNQVSTEELALEMIGEMIKRLETGGILVVDFLNKERFLPTRTQETRLSFPQLRQLAESMNCEVFDERGILFFGQTVLERVPGFLVPVWGLVEQMFAALFEKSTTRGYSFICKKLA